MHVNRRANCRNGLCRSVGRRATWICHIYVLPAISCARVPERFRVWEIRFVLSEWIMLSVFEPLIDRKRFYSGDNEHDLLVEHRSRFSECLLVIVRNVIIIWDELHNIIVFLSCQQSIPHTRNIPDRTCDTLPDRRSCRCRIRAGTRTPPVWCLCCHHSCRSVMSSSVAFDLLMSPSIRTYALWFDSVRKTYSIIRNIIHPCRTFLGSTYFWHFQKNRKVIGDIRNKLFAWKTGLHKHTQKDERINSDEQSAV